MKTVTVQEVITFTFEFPGDTVPFDEGALAEGNPESFNDWFTSLNDPWEKADSFAVSERDVTVTTLQRV